MRLVLFVNIHIARKIKNEQLIKEKSSIKKKNNHSITNNYNSSIVTQQFYIFNFLINIPLGPNSTHAYEAQALKKSANPLLRLGSIGFIALYVLSSLNAFTCLIIHTVCPFPTL